MTTTVSTAAEQTERTDDRAATLSANPLARRLELTGLALVDVVYAVPTLVLFTLLTVALSTSVVGVGLVLLLVLVPLVGVLADGQRGLAGVVRGTRVTSSYVPAPAHPWRRLTTWARDEQRWRDWVWMLWSVTGGWTLAWLRLGLGLGVIWYAVFPFVFAVTPAGTWNQDYGVYELSTQREAFYEWGFLLLVVPLWWFLTPVLARAQAAVDAGLLGASRAALERRVSRVSESRADVRDHSASELRRIERDLHDGAQARLVAAGMSLGLAEDQIRRDPEAAVRLVEEARATNAAALDDLRALVRGIHPPLLADRGLAGAVHALAGQVPVPVTTTVGYTGRLPWPVESAVYFAISECLANVGKHAGASRASVDLVVVDDVLHGRVVDDGRGGADPARGTGLAGIGRRLAAFDGTLGVTSPAGGPTTVTLAVPCAS